MNDAFDAVFHMRKDGSRQSATSLWGPAKTFDSLEDLMYLASARAGGHFRLLPSPGAGF